MVGQRRKFFLEPLKHLFHHSEKHLFENDKYKKEKHKQSMLISFQGNTAL